MAGRRLSAETRASLEKAIEHSQKFISTIREVLADDMADDAEVKAARVLKDWTRADTWL